MSPFCQEDIDSFDPESGPVLPSQTKTQHYKGADLEDILHDLDMEDILKEATFHALSERKHFIRKKKRSLRRKKV